MNLVARFIVMSCLSLGVVFSAVSDTGPVIVKYPQITDAYERAFDLYFIAMLKLALAKSGETYSLQGIESPLVPEARIHRMIDENRFSVYWLNSNVHHESVLAPVRVPLFKGLIGWRVLLITQGNQGRFDGIRDKSGLVPLKGIQGHDWPDTQIMKANQLQIETSASWDGMFRMLGAGRVDYFPRSVVEAQRELEIFKDLGISLESNLVLRYPAAYYFFVNKKNRELHFVLETGLQKAHADGSFDRLFEEHFSAVIKSLNLTERTVIQLDSLQYFPDKPEYWYNAPIPEKLESESGTLVQ